MFGPKIENKNCTKVRKLVLAFLNEGAGIVQQVIWPDEGEVVILLKSINQTFPYSFHGASQFLNMFAQIHSPNQINVKPALLIKFFYFKFHLI